jgi:hypothetical protein
VEPVIEWGDFDDWAGWSACFDIPGHPRRPATRAEIRSICEERGWRIVKFDDDPDGAGWAVVDAPEVDDAYDGGYTFAGSWYTVDVP